MVCGGAPPLAVAGGGTGGKEKRYCRAFRHGSTVFPCILVSGKRVCARCGWERLLKMSDFSKSRARRVRVDYIVLMWSKAALSGVSMAT